MALMKAQKMIAEARDAVSIYDEDEYDTLEENDDSGR